MRKRLIIKNVVWIFICMMLVVLSSCSSDSRDRNHFPYDTNYYPDYNTETNKVAISETEYDVVLSSGGDIYGNSYQLVGKQTETSTSFEISIGIIKNGQWLMPLNNSSEFLSEDGLFHVDAALSHSGCAKVDLYSASSAFRFIEPGCFVMKLKEERGGFWSSQTYTDYVFLSCSTQKYLRIDGTEYGVGDFFKHSVGGTLHTDNGNIVMYSSSGDNTKDEALYHWYILDTSTLNLTKIGENLKMRPIDILSEGLVYASDKCFYDTSMKKRIDLSSYNIDYWYNGDFYFQFGECSFEVVNPHGTIFIITIDTSGNVLSERQKQ